MESVEGLLNYLEDGSPQPTTYTYKPPEGVPARTGRYTKFPVRIHSARPIASQLSLDRNGFALTHQDTKISNFYDPEEVHAKYFAEVEQLVKEITGAIKVLVFDHNVRCRDMAKAGNKAVQEPVKVAHNDYTIKSGPQRVRDLLPDEADQLLKNRFAFINVWRPIRGPVQEWPLAVCDAQTIAPKDFVIHNLIYRDRVGEVYSLAYNREHKWFYFPQMQKSEVLLLKCYDSDAGRARFSAHSAFEDPTSPPNSPPRESIEARTIAFFAPQSH